jgi:quercetin dioxygenase-like cupin family protein
MTLTARPGAGHTVKAGSRRKPARRGPPKGFALTHAEGAHFKTGLRSYFSYRDLGIAGATEGRVVAHVIKAESALHESVPHFHETRFQLVYVLKGWIEFHYEGVGKVRLTAGSCVHQPPGIRHAELGHSKDLELLEVVMPADFKTVEVDSVEPPAPRPRAVRTNGLSPRRNARLVRDG